MTPNPTPSAASPAPIAEERKKRIAEIVRRVEAATNPNSWTDLHAAMEFAKFMAAEVPWLTGELSASQQSVETMRGALEQIIAFDKAAAYERCPDCTFHNNQCSREKGCMSIATSGGLPCERIARAALSASPPSSDLAGQLAEARKEIERLTASHHRNISERDRERKQREEAVSEKDAAEKRLADLTYKLRVPDGAVRVDAWTYKDWLIVIGEPKDADGNADHPHGHNCDAMGCTTFYHTVIREKLNEWGTPEIRDVAEAAESQLAEATRLVAEILPKIEAMTPVKLRPMLSASDEQYTVPMHVNGRQAWIRDARKVAAGFQPANATEAASMKPKTQTINLSINAHSISRKVLADLAHVCGAHGFGMGADDRCPMCDELRSMEQELRAEIAADAGVGEGGGHDAR